MHVYDVIVKQLAIRKAKYWNFEQNIEHISDWASENQPSGHKPHLIIKY